MVGSGGMAGMFDPMASLDQGPAQHRVTASVPAGARGPGHGHPGPSNRAIFALNLPQPLHLLSMGTRLRVKCSISSSSCGTR